MIPSSIGTGRILPVLTVCITGATDPVTGSIVVCQPAPASRVVALLPAVFVFTTIRAYGAVFLAREEKVSFVGVALTR